MTGALAVPFQGCRIDVEKEARVEKMSKEKMLADAGFTPVESEDQYFKFWRSPGGTVVPERVALDHVETAFINALAGESPIPEWKRRESRQYVAALAMRALIGKPSNPNDSVRRQFLVNEKIASEVARESLLFADALLVALEKTP